MVIRNLPCVPTGTLSAPRLTRSPREGGPIGLGFEMYAEE